ncbi:MAG: hypothetical protein IPH75_00265 [bacterium]|nr:hypothetical protein [bacterium]
MNFTYFGAPGHGFFPLFDEERITSGKVTDCPVDKAHNVGYYREGTIYLILPSTKVPPIFWTWASECVITEQVAELFDRENVTGYRLEKVVATGVRRGSKDLSTVPPLYELIVTGWGGMASPASGVKLVHKCGGCGYTKFSGVKDPAKLIDITQWDESDLFIIWPMPKYYLISPRLKQILKRNHLRQFKLVPPDQLFFVTGEFAPGTLCEYFGEKRGRILGKEIGLE